VRDRPQSAVCEGSHTRVVGASIQN
jgi:hypothetical protein